MNFRTARVDDGFAAREELAEEQTDAPRPGRADSVGTWESPGRRQRLKGRIG